MVLGSNGKAAALLLRQAFRVVLGSNSKSATLFLRRGLHGAQEEGGAESATTLIVGVKEA